MDVTLVCEKSIVSGSIFIQNLKEQPCITPGRPDRGPDRDSQYPQVHCKNRLKV